MKWAQPAAGHLSLRFYLVYFISKILYILTVYKKNRQY